MKIIFFDIETTGLSSAKDSILEIAAVVIDERFNVLDQYQAFVNPGRPIPFFITNITGITNDTVKNAKAEYASLVEFMTWVRKQNAQAVAGHNIKRFDLNWMIEKSNKFGIANYLNLDIIDTLEYSTRLHKEGLLKGYTATTATGRTSFKLEHLVRYFNLAEQTHRAIDDVLQNIVVYQKLKKLEEAKDYGF